MGNCCGSPEPPSQPRPVHNKYIVPVVTVEPRNQTLYKPLVDYSNVRKNVISLCPPTTNQTAKPPGQPRPVHNKYIVPVVNVEPQNQNLCKPLADYSNVRKTISLCPPTTKQTTKHQAPIAPSPRIYKGKEFLKKPCPEWKGLKPRSKDGNVILSATNVSYDVVCTILNLVNEGCTLPFIVRYRPEITGNLPAQKVREVIACAADLKKAHEKADNLLENLSEVYIDEARAQAIVDSKTEAEVAFWYTFLKPKDKLSPAEEAINLGLEPYAWDFVQGFIDQPDREFLEAVNGMTGLTSLREVKTGIKSIIADCISKDEEILDFILKSDKFSLRIETLKILNNELSTSGPKDKDKFKKFFNYHSDFHHISSHEVLAINRAESLHIISVSVQIPKAYRQMICSKCKKMFPNNMRGQSLCFANNCIDEAYEKVFSSYITTVVRSQLTKKAYEESIRVFCSNLEALLLAPPIRGKTVIGIDPGFTHGCKIAAVSPTGDILTTNIIYPHSSKKMTDRSDDVICRMVYTYKADLIGIGDGAGRRETEIWLQRLINENAFHPFKVTYCIVSESGVSNYSVSPEAEKEMPDLTPNLRSAVSLARRLQDPLLEYAKMEPKHLGIGMYQHDIPEDMLQDAVDSIIVQCVSFVGVDLNICPLVLLRKISGLTEKQAHRIIEYRERNRGFRNRLQLHEVDGLGVVSFTQCAGFVKIIPQTLNKLTKKVNKSRNVRNIDFNPLDSTVIHPESYAVALRFLKKVGATVREIGQESLKIKIEQGLEYNNIEILAKRLLVTPEKMEHIISALKQSDFDIREKNGFERGFFHASVRFSKDISIGKELIGCVKNVTSFGAFIDIGVEKDALLHISKIRKKDIKLGDKVSVKVIKIDGDDTNLKIGLELC